MKTILRLIFFVFLFPIANPIYSQNLASEISVTIHEYEGDTIFLAYRRADKVYSRDTAVLEAGKFVFRSEEALPTGVYLVLVPPDNKFFEFIITPEEQHFSVETTAPVFYQNLKFKNAPDNQLLYDYQNYMNRKGAESQALQEQFVMAQDPAGKAQLKTQQEEFFKSVRAHQEELMAQNPTTFTAKLVGVFMEPEVPEPPQKADGSIDETFQYRYFREHFFDRFDFSEPGFVNTPYLKQKIDQYLDKLTAQTPDSLYKAVDLILTKSLSDKEVFRYCAGYILNKYYRPQIVGLDAVFVHVANHYYRTGLTDWVSEENMKKILDDAYMISRVLIGNTAPEVKCQLFDYQSESFTDSLVSLHGLDAEYTVVFLWKPGCPACKQMTDELKEFYKEWKDKGVEVYAISSASHRDLDKAIKDIKLKEVGWITVADPYLKARALQNFYGTSLPKIYLLDRHKKILASRVGATQLGEIISKHRENLREADQ